MRRRARRRPSVAPTRRTTSLRRDRSENGDTLIEVLLALVVLALASVALIIAFTTSIAASAEHRSLASDDTVLATASQEIISAIQNEPSLFSDACTTPITDYPDYSPDAGFPLPAPYTNETNETGYDVQYLTQNPSLNQYPVLWWDSTTGTFTDTCVPNVPQLITISLVGTDYTNSFVVDYPIGSSGGSAGGTSADQLVFLNSIVGGYAGSPFTTQPIVAVEDNGVPVSTDLSPVTLTISSGTGVLSGCTGNEVLGVITFSGCTIGSGGTFQLEATDGNLTPAFSNSFTVTASNYQLVFTTEPKGGAAGSPFATPPVVSVENTAGSVDTSWQGSITVTSSGGEFTNCSNIVPQTVTEVSITVVNGVATMPSSLSTGCFFWGGYFYNKNSSPQVTATQYTLTATADPTYESNAAVPASSTAFSVSSFGPASKIAFTTEPTGVASSVDTTPFTGQPVVAVEDWYGNVVTSATNTITPAMFKGATSETLAGCTYTSSEGTYTFSGCHGAAYNDGLTLTMSSSGLTSATSSTFNITGVASQLIFLTSPTAGASGSAFTVQPYLVFEDASGNVVTAETSAIAFSVSPSSGTISSCTGLAPTNGYVNVGNCTFAGLVGTQYTLTATTTSGATLTSSPSLPFSPTAPGPAAQVVFTTQPVAGASGSVLTVQPVVKVEDSAGNVVTSSTASIVLTSSGNGAIANCTGLTASAGVVNVSNCTFEGNVNTSYYLIASSGTLAQAESALISPTGPGVLSQIELAGCPSQVTVGAKCTLSATLADNYGNIETGDSASLVTFSQVGGSGSFTGLDSAVVGGGVTTDVITAAVAGPVTLEATADGVTSNQLPVTVNAAPSITTTSLPAATQTGSYSQTLIGTGGTTPYSWSISVGSLPSGLSLNGSTGVISGTVGSTATSQTFTVMLTDADGITATQSLSITVNVKPSITTTSLATATQGQVNYSQPLAGTGGTTPYSWSVTTGHLPTGLSINPSTGAITGNVGSTATSETFTVTLTDANGVTATKSLTLTVNAAPSISPSSLPGATQTGSYSQTLTVSGGTTPYGAWSITTGSLPSGLTLNPSTGAITGTVGASATSQTFTVSITDANGVTATKTYTITVNAAPSITTTSLATATDGETGYSQTLAGTGGTTPYSWSITTGSLPTGLSLNTSTGAITGTVGATATSQTFTVTLTDANGVTATKSLTITVNVAPSITTTSLATATQTQTGYSQTLAGTGGTTPYSWSVTTGSLPSGLTLNTSTGAITGTVGASATSQTFTVTLTDANGVKATKSLTITVNASPTISPTTLPAATQTGAYSQTLSVSGGTTPFGSWSITTGSLPSGLTLNASTGVISGTVGATATSQTFTVSITDANGVAATQSLTITVNAAPSVTTTSLATATDGETGYSQTLTGTGGTTPYSWSVTTGSLPNGLTLNTSTGAITGTVGATATSQTFMVTLTDANGVTATKSLTITVNVAPSITTTSLATATDGETGYSQTLAGTGGTTPYSWSVTTGSLPSGLTLNASTGAITGTVGATATSQTFTVTLTDANGVKATKSLTITVNAAPSITTTSLATATDGETGYSQTLAGTGGTTPYSWSVTTGSLPSGLTLNASTGAITGTVGATATSQTFTVTLTDANGVKATKSLTITVNAAPSITTTSLPGATISGAYSQTLAETGGTTPLSWSVTTGSLPSGLTLNASTGAITGTVGATATSQTFTVTLTDANGVTATKSLTITVNAAPSITTTSLATATDGETGYSQTLAETGGTTPLSWSVTTGSLPSGLTLNASTGAITGTVGATATSQTFTVTLTDANGVTATKSLTLTVNAAPNITTTSLPGGTKTGAYSQALAETGGTAPLTWSVSSGILPTGLTISSTTGTISGTVSSTAASETFTVKVVDANGVSDTQSLTITINAAPSITTTSLPGATISGAYSQTVAATGGTSPLTWSISSGTLPTGLSINSSTGAITGTVGAGAVSETFTVKVVDSDGVSATQSLTITVNAAPSITTTSLAAATQTQATYSQTLAETGGTTPLTWSVTSGSLPSGLSLASSTGVISGSVGSGATSQTFTVTLTDANGVIATKSLTITVNAKPTISPTTLATATDTETGYSQTLSTSGGTTPFGAWSVSTGTLPSGLTLNTATGVISGTVGASATTSAFTIQITDANGVAATQSFTLTVNAAPNITTTSLPGGTKTGAYSQALAETGGTAPLTWSVSSGILPTGLTISSTTGTISGTVSSTAASETFTVKVVDANGVSDTQSLTITINAAPSIATTSLAATENGAPNYSQTLAGSGGTTPYSWSITTGNLPAGLALNASTGAITGSASSTASTQTFTVTLTDADGVTATKSLTITVNAGPTISTPTNGTAYVCQENKSVSIPFTVTGGSATYTWSTNNGVTWLETFSSTTGASVNLTGTSPGKTSAATNFTVTVTDGLGATATSTFSMKVQTSATGVNCP